MPNYQLGQKNMALETAIRELTTTNAKLDATLEAAQAEVSKLKATLGGAELEVSEKDMQIAGLELSLKSQKATLDGLWQERAELRKELDVLMALVRVDELSQTHRMGSASNCRQNNGRRSQQMRGARSGAKRHVKG